MPTTYEECDKQVTELIGKMLRKYHSDLAKEKVTVDALFAVRTNKHDDVEPALKRAGYPLAAKIQITSLADRARGVADAKLVIDKYAWTRLPESSWGPLIDHELEHLGLALNKYGAPKRDDLGRPKLKTIPHDYELAGFNSVIERHGEASIEARQFSVFKAEQLPLFPQGAL